MSKTIFSYEYNFFAREKTIGNNAHFGSLTPRMQAYRENGLYKTPVLTRGALCRLRIATGKYPSASCDEAGANAEKHFREDARQSLANGKKLELMDPTKEQIGY